MKGADLKVCLIDIAHILFVINPIIGNIGNMGRRQTLRLSTRLQIKVLIEETAMTQREIAKKFNISQSAVKNVNKMIKNQQLLESQYQGRARKTTARDDRTIINTAIRLRRKPIKEIHSNIVASGVKVSTRTVR